MFVLVSRAAFFAAVLFWARKATAPQVLDLAFCLSYARRKNMMIKSTQLVARLNFSFDSQFFLPQVGEAEPVFDAQKSGWRGALVLVPGVSEKRS